MDWIDQKSWSLTPVVAPCCRSSPLSTIRLVTSFGISPPLPQDIKVYLYKEIYEFSRGNNSVRSITKRETFGSLIMATIEVLVFELDLAIRGIGEELKGQTHLDKPYVANKTILHAVRRQNEVILAMQEKILDMAKIEAGLQLTMNALQKEVGASKYKYCEAGVAPIIVQGRKEVRHIQVKAGIGRPY